MTNEWSIFRGLALQKKKLTVPATAIVLALFALAQADKAATPTTAPLISSVAMESAGESVQLKGLISVQATFAKAPDGTATISYFCGIAGTGTGQISGTRYSLSGSGSGDTPVSVSLPADIGLTCAMSLVAEDKVQQYMIRLQGSLDAAGSLTSIVIRDIAARVDR